MQRQPTRPARHCWAVLAAVSCATPALAQGGAKPGDPRGPLVLLVFAPLVPFIVAALLPTFTKRAERAFRSRFGASFGWGILLAILAGVVAGILTKGGPPGQVAASVVAGFALLVALSGLVGLAKAIGDWSLRRWGMTSLGPLSVLLGAPLWLIGAAIPLVGWLAGIVTLVASIGVTACVVLAPATFDEPVGAEPPPADPIAPAVEPLSTLNISFDDEENPSPSDP